MLPALGSSSPPPPPTLETLATAKALQEQQRPAVTPPSASGDSISPSLLVIAAIIVFVFVVSASIHLLLRFLSRQSSSSSSGDSSPLALLRRAISSSSSSAAATPASPSSPSARRGGEDEQEDLIDSLPLFTLASALPNSSSDCAVCLSSFHPHDQLRLLPSCRHAFHSTCIDAWLRSSLSCPLCRSPIVQEHLPPPTARPPPLAPPLQPRAALVTSNAAVEQADRSGSFRLEIGSVSRRRMPDGDAPELPPHARSYSLGSSFQYVVEEEVEAVVAAVAAHVRQQRRKDDNKDPSDAAPAPPGEDVAEAAGGGGSRSWLRDYVDRLASSASSSFSSLRFSGCGSRRIDGGIAGAGWSWDLEGGLPRQGEDDEEGAGAYYSFYRWLIGV